MSLRIVFMGTPDFAVPSLRAVVAAGHQVAGVFTQPDRPVGRGHKVQMPPVKQAALELGLPVFQFERVRRKEGVAALAQLAPQLLVTAAFGQILPERILSIPQMGTVNVHGSLLPAYRGPAPVQWALYHGEKQTGITTMMTDIGIDTGDMLLKRALDIGEDEGCQSLHDRMAQLGAALLVETLSRMENGDCPRQKQDEALASYHPMIKKTDGLLDFRRSAVALYNQSRAFDIWPGTYAMMQGQVIRLSGLRPVDGQTGAAPGTVLCADARRGMVIQAGEGALSVGQVQVPGGKRMDAKAFLNGRSLELDRFDLPQEEQQ